MPRIGLSKPYYALYSNNGTTVTYSGGGLMGKYTQLNLSLDGGGSDNDFYADNGIDETESGVFTGGTLAVTTNNLLTAVSSVILGNTTSEITGVEGLQTQGAQWEHSDDRSAAPFVGVAGIYKYQINGQTKYRAVIYPKVKFTTPNVEATTQGSSIDWQVDELEAAINRDDTEHHEWRRLSSLLDTEADAELLIRNFFGIAEETPAPAAGSQTEAPSGT